MRADAYREALEKILQLVEPPEGAPIGSRGDGTLGPLWYEGQQEQALAEVARVVRDALGVPE